MRCRAADRIDVTAPLAPSLAALAVPDKGCGLAVPGLGGLLEPSADLGGGGGRANSDRPISGKSAWERQECRGSGATMARRARRTHNPTFKAKVALAAIKL